MKLDSGFHGRLHYVLSECFLIFDCTESNSNNIKSMLDEIYPIIHRYSVQTNAHIEKVLLHSISRTARETRHTENDLQYLVSADHML